MLSFIRHHSPLLSSHYSPAAFFSPGFFFDQKEEREHANLLVNGRLLAEADESDEEEKELAPNMVYLYDTPQSAKPSGSLLLLQPPFDSVKVRYFRLHLADTEGHVQVDEYQFAISTAKTNFEKVALSHQQEVLTDVASITTPTGVEGQGTQCGVILMVKHLHGVPKFNPSIAPPISTALMTPNSGGAGNNSAAGMFSSTSRTSPSTSGSRKTTVSGSKAAYRNAKASSLSVVARKVGVVDKKHAETFLELGHRALLQ